MTSFVIIIISVNFQLKQLSAKFLPLTISYSCLIPISSLVIHGNTRKYTVVHGNTHFEKLLKANEDMGCRLTLTIHYFHSHLNFFSPSLSGQWLASVVHGESLWSGQWLASVDHGESLSDQWLASVDHGESLSGQWLASVDHGERHHQNITIRWIYGILACDARPYNVMRDLSMWCETLQCDERP